MSKKVFLLVVAGLIIAAGVYFIYQNLSSQPSVLTKDFYRIGVLQTSPALEVAYNGFKAKLEELGYREGTTVSFDYFDSKGSTGAAKEQAERFVREKVDLIYVIGNVPAKAARQATLDTALPVVFSVVSDPVGAGIVMSLQTSGTNIAGVTPANQEASAKRVELLKEIKPDLKRIVFPYSDPVTAGYDNVKKAAAEADLELADKFVANSQELENFLSTFKFRETDAILRASDSVLSAALDRLINLAINNKIPLSGTNTNDSKKGALTSYGANYELLGRQAAVIADKIFRGANPADFPVEFPEKYELVVNQQTAAAIGLIIAPEFLAKVDVIMD